MDYPRLNFNCEIEDGGITIKEVIWPEGSDVAEVVIDLNFTDPGKELDNILRKIPFAVIAFPAGISIEQRGQIFHLFQSDRTIVRAKHHAFKLCDFWRWWEVRIIKTLAVWGLAEIRPGEIIDWHCIGRKS